MQTHENIAAYNGFEDLKNFTEESFGRYCHAKMEACHLDVELIRQHCVNHNWTGKICEIGSGNSKLLYALERSGILDKGIGFEISASRHAFAEKFKQWAGAEKTTNINANVFDYPPPASCDLICAMDIVVQMITPTSKDATTKLFSWVHSALKPGGHFIAELRDFKQFIKIMDLSENQTFQFWEEFPTPDPWRYNLNRLTFVEEGGRRDIRWEKAFLKRDSTDSSRTQAVWRPYDAEGFGDLLAQHGFSSFGVISRRAATFMVKAGKSLK